MEQDAYEIFTRAHRVYIKGIRTGFAECLKFAYGSDWWESGVLSALGDNQRENLERDQQKVAPEDLAQLLDTAHFALIVERNHAAFASQFTNIDYTLRLFSHLSAKRNEWAHVLDGQWTVPNIMHSVQAMREILISLRRREALEIHQMFQDSLDQRAGIPEEALNVPEYPTPALDGEDDPLPRDYALLGFWRTLESYLVVESVVQPATDEERDQGLVRVLVRVTNTAPSSEGRPDVTFRNVRLELTGVQALNWRGREYRNAEWTNLGPGQTETTEFMASAKGLASIELHAAGHVDQERLFQVQHRNTLPKEVVTPLLEQISAQFEGVGIDQALAKIVETATRIQPEMPFAEVSALRNELGQCKLLIAQKRQALRAIFEEYDLNRESRLGSTFQEVLILLEELEAKKIDEMDTAISQTDMESIHAVARDFEQLQISVLRARDTIRQQMSLRHS